jgi:hypothetical protein
MGLGNKSAVGWPWFRSQVPHNWYVDRRAPLIGFLSRDEAHIAYNLALPFRGRRALEIGCWLGWSTCHLALAGVQLDVVDPILQYPDFMQSVRQSLTSAGVMERVNLIPASSPQAVPELAARTGRKWSFIFIDGNHDAPAPLQDTIACEPLAEPDALILFHDLNSPAVGAGLNFLRDHGWNTIVYNTMQIMGAAWRGNVELVRHQPDPSVHWVVPPHLAGYRISS